MQDIRVLDSTDSPHVRDLFGRLSFRSRYFRYRAPIRSLSEQCVHELSSIDHETHEAVGAFDDGALVGAAHYFRSADDPTHAEISVEVADAHQRRGVGSRLVDELTRLARAQGITHFTANVLRENAPAMRLLDNAGPAVDLTDIGPVVHATIDTSPSQAAMMI